MHVLVKSGFLGDTCARVIVGCDVKGKAIWTNLIVAVSICGRCYFLNFLREIRACKGEN